MTTYVGIGVMSGTSLDGLDLCCVEFTGDVMTDIWSHRILHVTTIAYSADWTKMLTDAPTYSGLELMRLHVEYGHLIGRLIEQFIERNDLKVNFVACHGHTIFHQPESSFTCQIGDGETIAAYLTCPLVDNFRNKDVALGGQGAPLVPIGEQYLFSQFNTCLNLGGIANVSLQQRGFDIGPCNMFLNHLAKRHDESLSCDEDGRLARRGNVIPTVQKELDALEFYSLPPPKSFGRERFDRDVLPIVEKDGYSPVDLLRTAVEHIAGQIVSAITRNLPQLNVSSNEDNPSQSLLVTGGGALNVFLMETLRAKLLHSGLTITESDTVTVQFKEALIFAFLGLRCLLGLSNIRFEVTGARCDSVSGSIHLPPGGVPLSSPSMQDYRFHFSRKDSTSSDL